MYKSILILGGAGFIGSNLAKRFSEAGHLVTVIDGLLKETGGNVRNIRPIADKINFINSAIEELPDLKVAVENSDLIIDCMGWTSHLEAIGHPDYDLQLNCHSHLALIKMLQYIPGKTVIYLGSRGQYGNPQTTVIDEDTPMVPEDIQGVHKLAAENHYRIYSKLFKFNVISLRFANCYGENQKTTGPDIGLIGLFIRDIVKGQKIELYGIDRQRNLLYVKDLVSVVVKFSLHRFSGFQAYNVAGQNLPIIDIVKTLIDVNGTGEYEVREAPDYISKIEIGNAGISDEKLRRLIGETELSDYKLGLKNTMDYFKRNL